MPERKQGVCKIEAFRNSSSRSGPPKVEPKESLLLFRFGLVYNEDKDDTYLRPGQHVCGVGKRSAKVAIAMCSWYYSRCEARTFYNTKISNSRAPFVFVAWERRATSQRNPPTFEGQQSADGAIDGGVKQDFCPAGNQGRPPKRTHNLSHVELPRQTYEERIAERLLRPCSIRRPSQNSQFPIVKHRPATGTLPSRRPRPLQERYRRQRDQNILPSLAGHHDPFAADNALFGTHL